MPQPLAPFYVRQREQGMPEGCDVNMARRAKAQAEAGEYGLAMLRKKKILQPVILMPNSTPPYTLAANSTGTITFLVDREFDFELHYINCVVDVPALSILQGRGDDFTMRIQDSRTGEYMSNGLLHYLTMTGTGIYPMRLPETRYFKNTTTINVEVVNRRAVDIDIWMEFHGVAIYQKEFANLTGTPDFERLSQQAKEYFLARQKRSIMPYMYTLDGGPLSLGAGDSVSLQPATIRQEGDFECIAINMYSTMPFSCQMRRGQGGRLVQTMPVAGAASFGDGERSMVLPTPLWLDANMQIQIDFTNESADEECVIFPTFIGRLWKDTASMNLTAGPDFYFDKFNDIPDRE